MLVRQSICADGTGYEATESAQGTTAELVSYKSASGTTEQSGTQASFTINWAIRTSRGARLVVLALLTVLIIVLRLVAILVMGRSAIGLLSGGIGRSSTVVVVTLVVALIIVIASGRTTVILLRRLVLAIVVLRGLCV